MQRPCVAGLRLRLRLGSLVVGRGLEAGKLTELEYEAASNAALPRHPRFGHNVKGGGVGACIDLLKNGQMLLMVPAAVLFCKFLGNRCHLLVVS